MARMSADELDRFLREPHVAVLAVGRAQKGPVAVPVWYDYDGERFRIATAPSNLHSRLMLRSGRATLTMHREHYNGTQGRESYAMIEGPIAFTDDDIEPHLRRVIARYRGADVVDALLAELLPRCRDELKQRIAALTPQRMTGHSFP